MKINPVALALVAAMAFGGISGAASAAGARKGGMFYQPVMGVAATDHGGAITVGGTAQVAIPANLARKGGYCQNPVSASEDLFISTTGTAPSVAGAGANIDLAPGAKYDFVQGNVVDTGPVSVNATTSAHKYICVELH